MKKIDLTDLGVLIIIIPLVVLAIAVVVFGIIQTFQASITLGILACVLVGSLFVGITLIAIGSKV